MALRRLLFAAAFATLALTPAREAAAQTPPAVEAGSDEAAIHDVIDRFKAALVAKDKPGMANLFHEGNVVWLSSGHPSSRDAMARMTGEPAQIVEDEGAYELLDDPRLAEIAIEERFYDPVIRTDGQIATVTFDYDFRAQGQIQNWGQESWQMVKTEAGWKILHLLFSVNLQLITPAPSRGE